MGGTPSDSPTPSEGITLTEQEEKEPRSPYSEIAKEYISLVTSKKNDA